VIKLNSFEISDEQRMRINDVLGVFQENINRFIEAMNCAVEKAQVKPILDRIKEMLANRHSEIIKYRPIKILIPNSYFGINKPMLIHCRNNC
jgi:hypothetical protein